MQRQRRIYLLDFISFLSQCSIYMINLSLVYHLRYTLSTSSFIVGSAASVYSIAYLIGCVFAVPLFIGVEKARLVQSSYLGMGISIALMMLTESIPIIFLLLFFYGLAMSLLWPSMEGWLTDGLDGDELSSVLSSFCFSWSSAAAVSSVIASFFIDDNPSVSFAVAIGGFALSFILAGLAGKGEAGYASSAYKGEDRPGMRIIAWICVAIAYAMFYIVLNIFPMFAAESIGMSTRLSGFILFIRGIVTCVVFIFVSGFRWWRGSEKRLLMLQLIMALISALFAFSSSAFSIAVSMIVFAFFYTLSYSLSAYFSASGSADKVNMMRIHEAMINGGSVFGCFFGGWIYGELDYTALWLIMALVIALIAASEAIALKLIKP